MKIEENYWLLEVTGHHVLLEVTEICHEPFLLSPSENSLHTPSLKFRPESSNWSNYPNYFKLLLQLQKFYFLPQVTSQCTNPNFLKFFHIPSCSFPEAPQDTFKGRSSLQASFEPIPGITRHVWLCQQVLMREYKLWGAGIQLWQTKLSWLHASFSDDEPTDHALSSRTGLFSGWPKHYNRPRAKHRLIDVDSGNKPISTFKLSARFRL